MRGSSMVNSNCVISRLRNNGVCNLIPFAIKAIITPIRLIKQTDKKIKYRIKPYSGGRVRNGFLFHHSTTEAMTIPNTK